MADIDLSVLYQAERERETNICRSFEAFSRCYNISIPLEMETRRDGLFSYFFLSPLVGVFQEAELKDPYV